MKKAKEAFQLYLQKAGQLETVTLGDTNSRIPPHATEQDSAFLEARIRSAETSTKVMLALMTGMLVVVFGIGVIFILGSANSIGAAAAWSAGVLAVLLAIVERLRRLWIERAILELAWAAVREWTPESTLALVELLYWHSLGSSRTASKLPIQLTRPHGKSP